MVALLQDIAVIHDDTGTPCTYNTMTHNPLEKDRKQDLPVNEILEVQFGQGAEYQLLNKARGQDIYF